MPAIIEMSSGGEGYIIRVIEDDGTGYVVLDNAWVSWRTNNPDATAADLEAYLEAILNDLDLRGDMQVHVHVYEPLPDLPEKPHIALLIIRDDATIPADWYVIEEGYS